MTKQSKQDINVSKNMVNDNQKEAFPSPFPIAFLVGSFGVFLIAKDIQDPLGKFATFGVSALLFCSFLFLLATENNQKPSKNLNNPVLNPYPS